MPSENICWPSFHKQMGIISQDKNWVDGCAFQQSVFENACQRLSRRAKGWFAHRRVLRSDLRDFSEDKEFEKALIELEDKHFSAYWRWKGGTKAPGTKFKHSRSYDRKEGGDDISERIKRLLLFYLTYGEIHDFRNMKHVLNLFYNTVLYRYEKQEKNPPLGEWVRQQGHKLYKLFGVVYYKDEMNRFGFHHDDLDDLCNSSSFVKDFYKKECDFHKVFNLQESFPAIFKMCQESTTTFIKYWLKSALDGLKPEERKAREHWMRSFKDWFPDKVRKELEELNIDETLQQKLQQAETEKNKAESERNNLTDRGRANVEEFTVEDDRNLFRKAFTQLETAKQLLSTAESIEKEADELLNKAKVKDFREKEISVKDFKSTFQKFEEVLTEYKEADAGLGASINGFTSLLGKNSGVKSYLLESKALQKKAYWASINMEDKIQRAKLSRIIQHGFEDAIAAERRKFAKKYKTFYEAAGGWLGLSGYFTIFRHYSDVVYLHLFLLFPLAWLYFDWQNTVNNNNWASLVNLNGLYNVENNILLTAGLTIILIIMFILIFHICGCRTRGGTRAPRRDSGTPLNINVGAWFQCFILWIFTLATELVIMKYLILNPIKAATTDFIVQFFNNIPKNSILLLIQWIPVIVLYFSSLQYMFSFWVGVFGWFYGMIDGVHNTITWTQLENAFYVERKKDEQSNQIQVPKIVEMFWKTMIPKSVDMSKVEDRSIEDENGLSGVEREKNRKIIGFARVWNEIIQYFYEIHKLSKEEVQKYSYQIKFSVNGDYLDGKVEQTPRLTDEPKSPEVAYHLIRFVNNVLMKKKPNTHSVREMIPLTILTPVGAEKIIYPYEYITHVDNTQSSFLGHLIRKLPHEWENFKKREASTVKAKDYIERLEKDIMQGIQPDQSKGRWIHSHKDGIALKNKICEWGSLRFQALYRTINGFMQIPNALAVLVRIQEPKLSQEDAERLVSEKFSYIVGYQSYGDYYDTYKKSKSKIKSAQDLTPKEAEAHDAVYNIKYIQKKFPKVRFVYPDKDNDRYRANLIMGQDAIETYGYKIELFGPFFDLGLGKPTHQNMLSQFLDGLAVQTIDINQDSVISQSFFIPNVLAEFDKDSKVKIVGLPEFVITTNWSGTAWCAAFAEHTFGTLVQRVYGKLAVRLHYGHPDVHDALWIMTETGLSKLSYVSEDVFTGFDCLIKGGKNIHVEYHEVGKARDVDLYTTTKFIRKIAMGGAQMACSRYIWYLQTSKNTSFFQRLSLYYSTAGFYLNHLMLYLSIWFALVSQLLLIIIDKYILQDDISVFMVERVFSFQVGFALIVPGVLELILESGFIVGMWRYISHCAILVVYSTFHILNTSAYWQHGLTKPSFYLPSGRGSGLEHYFMKDMYETFYSTHWRPAFIIFWMGMVALFLSGNILLFIFMFLLPSAIWLWGAMFLNPGALPSTVHEEQWKRLVNRDMEETKGIVLKHVKWNAFDPIEQRSFFLRRWYKSIIKSIHYVYTAINFGLHTRVLRFIAIIVLLWGLVFSSKIPTYIFTDERRRVLRWDEEETRQKSIFYSNMATSSNSLGLSQELETTPTNTPFSVSKEMKSDNSTQLSIQVPKQPQNQQLQIPQPHYSQPEHSYPQISQPRLLPNPVSQTHTVKTQPQSLEADIPIPAKKLPKLPDVTFPKSEKKEAKSFPKDTPHPKPSTPEDIGSGVGIGIHNISTSTDENLSLEHTSTELSERLSPKEEKKGGVKRTVSILTIPGEKERLKEKGVDIKKKSNKKVRFGGNDSD